MVAALLGLALAGGLGALGTTLAGCPGGGTLGPVCDVAPVHNEAGPHGGDDPCSCDVFNEAGDYDESVYTVCVCAHHDGGDYFPEDVAKCDAGSAGDAAADGPIPACNGECVPTGPLEWTAPVLVWWGPESDAPPCPELAPSIGWEGRAGLSAANATCGACSCDAPTGSCSAPDTITANAAACSGSTALHTAFDPPAAWDGGCTAENAVDAGVLCGGTPVVPGVKCVQSITIPPLVMHESCAATVQVVPHDKPAVVWSTFARACTSGGNGSCAMLDETCAPTGPAGFRQCVLHEGDVDCPSFTPYSDKVVYYLGVDDTRGCSDCACSAPAGSTCSATLSIFSDHACGTVLDTASLNAATLLCHDVTPGSALGSKSMETATYVAGKCDATGGQPIGSATAAEPSTICCLP